MRISDIPMTVLPATVRAVLEGIDRLLIYRVPMTTRFRGVTSREGILLHGTEGWGEAAPFWEYDAHESSAWLMSALSAATVPHPKPLRRTVGVNVTIPVCTPEQAYDRVLTSGGCTTAKVKVADPKSSIVDDIARVEAVADALAVTAQSEARIRVDANGAWGEDEAIAAIRELDDGARAIGGLEYVEQPCSRVEELAYVRRHVDVPIAADESIRRAHDPLRVARAEAADIAVIKVAPLGGMQRALSIAEETGLDVVFSSALETSVGLATGVKAAAALPGQSRACGLATASLLSGDVGEPLAVVSGEIIVRDVEVDEGIIDAYPVDEDLLSRWGERLESISVVMRQPGWRYDSWVK